MNVNSLFLRFWIACLTFSAGAVNAACLVNFSFPVSHQSGNITQMALCASNGNFSSFFKCLFIVLFFFFGAFISGLLFHRRSFKLKKRYGILLMTSSFIFLVFHFFCFPKTVILCALSTVLGLQNGMFIFYDNILIRTTHLTGYLTDAAFFLGKAARSGKKNTKEVLFYIVNIAVFFLGAFSAILIPANYIFLYLFYLYLFSGSYYFAVRIKNTKNLK